MLDCLMLLSEFFLLITQQLSILNNVIESIGITPAEPEKNDEDNTSLFDETAKFIGQYVIVLVIIGMVQASTGFNIMYEDLSDNQRMTAALFGLVCVHVIRNRENYIDAVLPPLDKILDLVITSDGSVKVSTKFFPIRNYYTAINNSLYPDKNNDVYRMYEWQKDRLKCNQFRDLKGKNPIGNCEEFNRLYKQWLKDAFWVRDNEEPDGWEWLYDIYYEIKMNRKRNPPEPKYYKLLEHFLDDFQMFSDFGYQFLT
jgi:hypothetical protein